MLEQPSDSFPLRKGRLYDPIERSNKRFKLEKRIGQDFEVLGRLKHRKAKP